MLKLNSKQRGATILEVLISVLVLAVGILGVTNLQSASLRNATKSMARTQAANLAYEILDRIRANPSELYTVAYDALPTGVDCFSNTCSTAQLKNFDLAEWKCNFAQYSAEDGCTLYRTSAASVVSGQGSYLNGDGSVTCAWVGNEKQCQVDIKWVESAMGSDTLADFDFSMKVIL